MAEAFNIVTGISSRPKEDLFSILFIVLTTSAWDVGFKKIELKFDGGRKLTWSTDECGIFSAGDGPILVK